MPFGIGARLPINKAAKRLDLGYKGYGSTVAQAPRQQAAHDDLAVFGIIFLDICCLVEDEVRIVVFLGNGNLNFPPAEIRDLVETWKSPFRRGVNHRGRFLTRDTHARTRRFLFAGSVLSDRRVAGSVLSDRRASPQPPIHDLERNQHFCSGPLQRIVPAGPAVKQATL
jgi:hypothetical protein